MSFYFLSIPYIGSIVQARTRASEARLAVHVTLHSQTKKIKIYICKFIFPREWYIKSMHYKCIFYWYVQEYCKEFIFLLIIKICISELFLPMRLHKHFLTCHRVFDIDSTKFARSCSWNIWLWIWQVLIFLPYHVSEALTNHCPGPPRPGWRSM